MILEFRNIEKKFGDKKVLKGVNFTAKSGVANGYLGRNGSGKTTSFRILLNIFKADKGEILIDGKPINHNDIKIGYLPEERGMYDGIGLVDQLAYFGMLKGMTKSAAKTEAKRWLDFFELEDNKKALKTLSKGNAQKVQIIQSVINNPDILVFDEPFSGLDPVNVGKLKEIITNFIKKDKLVIFSSHQMPVVETFCEDINILEKGKIVLSGNLDYIKKQLGHGKMLLSVSDIQAEELLANLKTIPLGIDYSLNNDMVLLDFKEEEAKKKLFYKLSQSNFNVEELKLYKPSLEEIFVESIGGK
ncbi:MULTISPECIES: ABC transporter ATP-binding protein [Gemella]|uniref:ABC transporter ATP-binding protein n=1 Tax=Gemella TaxID=1378 RepID=UPI0007680240|nr:MULTISPECIES: ATP-binding cassette domain-containing protein [Gemella]AME08854.1 ABC transporter ATP-binding protein [Gemella sp. oral taxon 928]